MTERNQWTRSARIIGTAVLASGLVVGPWSGTVGLPKAYASGGEAAAAAAAEAQPKLTLTKESIVSSGVLHRTYQWSRMKNGKLATSQVSVIRADLTNPYVKLDVMTGRGEQFTKLDNTLNMARGTGAIAGINGDYFNVHAEGAPIGPQITSGELMSSPTVEVPGMYTFGVTKDRKPMIEMFGFEGSVTAEDGESYTLSGVNQTYAWFGATHSHGHAIHLYTSAWGSKSRGNDGATTPTEVLVEDDVVKQIVPNGTIDAFAPEDGYILRASGKGADFVAQHIRVGDKLDTDTKLISLNSNVKASENDFEMLIGGHTILVADGKPAAYSRDVSSIGGTRSRSAVGYSQDERFVYLIAADRAEGSEGLTLSELKTLLVQLGVWRAVNLDGGGSTTLVSRPLGEFQTQLANTPEYGSQRSIVNALGVFTTAPQGTLKDFLINGPSMLWKGETAQYAVKAYDTYYNPLDPTTLTKPMQFASDAANVIVTPEGAVTATAGGKATINAVSGDVRTTAPIEVTDRAAIVRLTVSSDTPPAAWTPGGTYRLEVKGTLKDGRTRSIPAELIRWEQYGLNGKIEGGRISFSGFADGAKEAMLVARYDQYASPLAVPVPYESVLTNFEQVPWLINFTKYPEDSVGGGVKLSKDYPAAGNGGGGSTQPNTSLALAYNFTAGDGTQDLAAYIKLNGDNGVELKGQPSGVKLAVHGDGQGGWLRAEFATSDGEIVRKTIAESVDWKGWRQLTVGLNPNEQLVKLNRIYIVSKSKLQGEIAVDNLTLLYPERPAGGADAGEIKLVVGKTDVTVRGAAQKLDQPPLVEQERTFVPVRFVVDALGGNVAWNNAEKKATIRKGAHFIELWVGNPEMIADGKRIQTDAAPIVRNGRTLLPLRFVSEQLGLDVVWVAETKEIIIKER